LRRVVFIWVIKSASWTSWIAEELRSAHEALHGAGVEVDVRIFVTCDSTFTEELSTAQVNPGCRCDVGSGPCCCVGLDDIDEKDDPIRESKTPVNQVAKSGMLDFATMHARRPDFEPLLWETLDRANGETGVAVCGPLGMTSCVRTVVAKVSDQRGAAKGTGAEGVYLHSECFNW
jgi:ferric-chelate reductase